MTILKLDSDEVSTINLQLPEEFNSGDIERKEKTDTLINNLQNKIPLNQQGDV